MSETQLITGRKFFFIHPNLTVFPETLCEDFMIMGYECYFVMKDTIMPIDTKFDILLNSFKDCVLYFNIDAPEPKPDVSWLQFIKNLNKKYDNKLLVGIMYSKRPSKQEDAQIGFLYENEARATCKARFNYQNKDYFITITDMSLSHFTMTFNIGGLPVNLNDKIDDIEFNIRGTHFVCDATVLFKRAVDGNNEIFVLAFNYKDGRMGLESKYQDMILSKLYVMLTERFNKDLMEIYEKRLHPELQPRDIK